MTGGSLGESSRFVEAFRDYMTDLVSHEIDANKMEQKN